MLIHDMWMTSGSWDGFAGRLNDIGCTAMTPSWPGLQCKDAQVLRADPAPLVGIGSDEVADHYETFVRGLGVSPLLVGHGYGGLVVQKLLDRGLGAAGVAICPPPPKMPRRVRRAGRQPIATMDLGRFRRVLANTMPEESAAELYDRLYIPGSGRMLAEGARFAVDFRNAARAPLLLIAADRDRLSPASGTRSLARRYGRAPAVTKVKRFAGRSHLIIAEGGWEEVVDYIVIWSLRNMEVTRLGAGRTPHQRGPVAAPAREPR